MDEQVETIKRWLNTGAINIFGLPFAGKDTQCKILAEILGGSVISSGDVLRHDHGHQKVQELMAAGEIIPSELFEEIVVPYLKRPEFEGKPLILSEVGRMEGEDQAIVRATENTGHPQKAVILLNLLDDEVWRRFEVAQVERDRDDRADDNRAVLQTRLDSYHQNVEAVLNRYRSIGLLSEVDGSLSREEVTKEIINVLTAKASTA